MRQALGRGLGALIPEPPKKAVPSKEEGGGTGVLRIPLKGVRPNHLQPRRHFDPEKLSELAQSIRENGLAQPIVVSHDSATNSYELIAGERRLRAAELAGLTEIEAVVKAPASDRERLELSIVENIQREDLDPIETALGYLRLMKEFSLSQTALGQRLGRSKSAVSNTLRLLDLPEEMRLAVHNGELSEGHARAILSVQEPLERAKLFRLVVSEGLSVRQVEEEARRIQAGGELPARARPKAAAAPKPADLRFIEEELQRRLGTKVEIRTRADGSKGRVVIHFFNLDDFDKVVKVLKK